MLESLLSNVNKKENLNKKEKIIIKIKIILNKKRLQHRPFPENIAKFF